MLSVGASVAVTHRHVVARAFRRCNATVGVDNGDFGEVACRGAAREWSDHDVVHGDSGNGKRAIVVPLCRSVEVLEVEHTTTFML